MHRQNRQGEDVVHRHPPLFFQQDSHNVPLTCLPRQARLPRRASEQAPSWRPMNHLHCEAVSLTEVGSSWPKDAQNGTHSASRLAHAGSPIEERHDAAGITKRPVHHALFALPRSRPDLVLTCTCLGLLFKAQLFVNESLSKPEKAYQHVPFKLFSRCAGAFKLYAWAAK